MTCLVAGGQLSLDKTGAAVHQGPFRTLLILHKRLQNIEYCEDAALLPNAVSVVRNT